MAQLRRMRRPIESESRDISDSREQRLTVEMETSIVPIGFERNGMTEFCVEQESCSQCFRRGLHRTTMSRRRCRRDQEIDYTWQAAYNMRHPQEDSKSITVVKFLSLDFFRWGVGRLIEY